MKLIFCEKCLDILHLHAEKIWVQCSCKMSKGVLKENNRAEVRGICARIVCISSKEFSRSLLSNNSSQEFKGWILPAGS